MVWKEVNAGSEGPRTCCRKVPRLSPSQGPCTWGRSHPSLVPELPPLHQTLESDISSAWFQNPLNQQHTWGLTYRADPCGLSRRGNAMLPLAGPSDANCLPGVTQVSLTHRYLWFADRHFVYFSTHSKRVHFHPAGIPACSWPATVRVLATLGSRVPGAIGTRPCSEPS